MMRRIWRHMGKIVVAAALLFLLVGIFLPANQNGPPGPVLRDQSQLDAVHLTAMMYLDTPEASGVPDSWRMMIDRGMLLPEDFVSTNRDPAPASTMLDSIRQGTEADPFSNEAWEQIGDIMLSREPAAFSGYRRDLITGFFLYPSWGASWRRPALVNFVFGDNRVQSLPVRLDGKQSSEYLDVIAADRRVRAAAGLSEPLDYAAVIREYMESQGAR